MDRRPADNATPGDAAKTKPSLLAANTVSRRCSFSERKHRADTDNVNSESLQLPLPTRASHFYWVPVCKTTAASSEGYVSYWEEL